MEVAQRRYRRSDRRLLDYNYMRLFLFSIDPDWRRYGGGGGGECGETSRRRRKLPGGGGRRERERGRGL